jgi:hypothetical protein
MINRRGLLALLSGLPFLPKALAEPATQLMKWHPGHWVRLTRKDFDQATTLSVAGPERVIYWNELPNSGNNGDGYDATSIKKFMPADWRPASRTGTEPA